MSYDYTGYQVQLGTLMALTSANPALPPTDPYFAAILPGCIDYAEQRIYRDLDIQSTTETSTVSCTAGSSFLTLPTAVYVVESLTIYTLADGAPPLIGTPTVLTAVDKGFLFSVYPPAFAPYAQGQPEFYYMQDQATAILGPCPDQSYTINAVYTFRPTPLSATNTTTVLTEIWPDLFIAASMVYMSGYQKNFGSQSDDPKMAISWEDQYQTLLKGALAEEATKKSMAADYTPLRVSPFTGKPPVQ
jgi:hypothetical protein